MQAEFRSQDDWAMPKSSQLAATSDALASLRASLANYLPANYPVACRPQTSHLDMVTLP